jgi:MYXO-CTERM domain-containing protein
MPLGRAKYWVCALFVLGCAGRTSTSGDSDADARDTSIVVELPPPPRIPPEIPDFSPLDRDADRIDDALATELAELDGAALERPIRILLHFDGPVMRAELATFTAHGGAIKKVFGGVGYALSGTLPSSRIRELAQALGPALLLVSAGRRIVHHLEEATQNGRVRPIWAADFAAGMAFSGSSSVNIGIVDSGVSGNHTDLSGRQEFWHDYTADDAGTAVDFGGHGTHVAGIAVGSGAAFGNGPGTLLFTDSGDLTGVSDGSFFAGTLHLPATPLTFSGTAAFEGGTGATMLSSVGASDGGNGWASLGGSVGSGPSPLSFSVSFTPSAASHYSTCLQAPANHYAVAASVTNYPAVGDGFPALRGVASSSRWAGFKVFENDGDGTSLDLFEALQGVLDNAALHSIKVINMSLGLDGSGTEDPGLRAAVNTLVSNGILVVVSAGNVGPGGVVSDPGRARLALTVGASSDQNRVTEYSSFGFTPAVASEGMKPDVLAPGGSLYRSMIMAADTNESDANSAGFADRRLNDYAVKQGTSMAAPFVAGGAALVIQSLESTGVSWTFSGPEQPMFVKMLLAAAATETTAGREGGGGNDPSLGRASAPKDPSEGFGIVNPDAAVEALRVAVGAGFSGSTTGGVFDRRAWGRKIELTSGKELEVALDVSANADFDLYLYDSAPLDAGTSSAEGVPNRLASSTTAGNGADELLSYTAPTSGIRYLFVKRVGGSGSFTLTTNLCGDGVVDPGEACDDGNGSNGDCCSNSCQAISGACSDGNGCTQTDTCQSGSCVGSNPTTCPASDQCHVAGTCDTGTGICSNPRKTDGASCDDGNPCTTLDACSLGVCAAVGFVVCTAADECHAIGTCNPSTGACSNPEQADGTECSVGECRSGDCVPDASNGGKGGSGSGGAPQAGRGNASGSGGVGGSAGTSGSGNASGSGGVSGSAGTSGSGNASGSGGVSGSGGSPGSAGAGATSGSGNSGGRPASGGAANQAGSATAAGGLGAAGGVTNAGQGAGNEGGGALSGGASSGGRGTAGDATQSGSSQGAAAGEGDDPALVTTTSTHSKGCGCSVPSEERGNSYAALGLAWLLVAAARRRRRHAPET